MCRCGEEEVGKPQDFPLETSKKDVSAHTTPQGPVSCELCDSEASIYCRADDAFLCRKCDKKVHGANFLAQRHIRCLLCSTCQSLTHRYLVGVSVEVVLPTIVSKKGRNHCYKDVEGKYTEELKRPFLLL